MNPSCRNLFMKKLTRGRVVPITSARGSPWDSPRPGLGMSLPFLLQYVRGQVASMSNFEQIACWSSFRVGLEPEARRCEGKSHGQGPGLRIGEGNQRYSQGD